MLLVVRTEVDPAVGYHCDELAAHFPDRVEYDFPAAGGPPSLAGVDGVVITGSTAGVYERADRPWIADLEAFVRTLVDRRVPTLGVCFGHQVANAALGGRVEAVDPTHRLVEVTFDDDPLFDGVEPVVAAVHGDEVTAPGEPMEVVASAAYYDAFGTRHARAPLWTVQFHPEFTAALRDRIGADFGWTETARSFSEVNAPRVFGNFRRLVAEHA